MPSFKPFNNTQIKGAIRRHFGKQMNKETQEFTTIQLKQHLNLEVKPGY
jgi:hypothetical protein